MATRSASETNSVSIVAQCRKVGRGWRTSGRPCHLGSALRVIPEKQDGLEAAVECSEDVCNARFQKGKISRHT